MTTVVVAFVVVIDDGDDDGVDIATSSHVASIVHIVIVDVASALCCSL